jgi:hypothetical protein
MKNSARLSGHEQICANQRKAIMLSAHYHEVIEYAWFNNTNAMWKFKFLMKVSTEFGRIITLFF